MKTPEMRTTDPICENSDTEVLEDSVDGSMPEDTLNTIGVDNASMKDISMDNASVNSIGIDNASVNSVSLDRQDTLNASVNNISIDRDDDDVDPEISHAMFLDGDMDDLVNQGDDVPDVMSKSWHGSRASVASRKSLSFYVDLGDVDAAPPTPSGLLQRSISHSHTQRKSSSARSRTRTGSMSQSGVSFFVDMGSMGSMGAAVRSTSRIETSSHLSSLSVDMRTKSKQLLARNTEQTQTFFNKLKAFIDFLSLPNYSKEEVRQKKILADRITRLMFEEEQRLRSGLSLSEMKKLDDILKANKLKGKRPISAYADLQSSNSNQEIKNTETNDSTDKPVLRRERTFDLESNEGTPVVENRKDSLDDSDVVDDEKVVVKQADDDVITKNQSERTNSDDRSKERNENNEGKEKNSWMSEDNKTRSEKHLQNKDLRGICEDFNLLQYFQEQRLEHTKLLRKEIRRLESLDKAYFSAIMQPRECWGSTSRNENEKDNKNEDTHINNTENTDPSHPPEVGFNRSDSNTFTKSDRKRISQKLANAKEKDLNAKEKELTCSPKTNFKEMATRKKKKEGKNLLQRADSNSPSSSSLSWYIPADNAEGGSPGKSSLTQSCHTPVELTRQKSQEPTRKTPSSEKRQTHREPRESRESPQQNSTQDNLPSGQRQTQTQSWGSRSYTEYQSSPQPIYRKKETKKGESDRWMNKPQNSRSFGQTYPTPQASQDMDYPPTQKHCRGIQTGSSLLRMYLRKDKGQQLSSRPQAFFLPLSGQDGQDPGEEKTNLIDLETASDAETTDLQKALRKHRPDYIAAADERAGRLHKSSDERKQKPVETKWSQGQQYQTKPNQPHQIKPIQPHQTKPNHQGAQHQNSVRRSQSSPGVNQEPRLSVNNNTVQGVGSNISRIANNLNNLKSMLPLQSRKHSNGVNRRPGDKNYQQSEERRRSSVTTIKSRTSTGSSTGSTANRQHFNLQSIYAPNQPKNKKSAERKAY